MIDIHIDDVEKVEYPYSEGMRVGSESTRNAPLLHVPSYKLAVADGSMTVTTITQIYTLGLIYSYGITTPLQTSAKLNN